MPAPLLQLRAVGKAFGPVSVLRDISLTLESGQVLALLGENGAGKSTLMNLIAGVDGHFRGEMQLAGSVKHFSHPTEAQNHGVVLVHQELSLIPELSAVENIVLGNEPKTRWGMLDRARATEIARRQLQRLDVELDLHQPVKTLSLGEQQVVEIARGLAREVKLLLLDEPTAALSGAEVSALFNVVKQLAAEGVGVVYISHRLEELPQVASHVAVLRNGELALHGALSSYSDSELIYAMVGDEPEKLYQPQPHTPGECVLRITQRDSEAQALHLDVHAGEIVGVAGLLGSGAETLLKHLGGITTEGNWRYTLKGEDYAPQQPREALDRGIALVTEDRKTDALVMTQTVRSNLELPQWPGRTTALCPRELESTAALLTQLAVKCTDPGQGIAELSGGNQQKVVLGRWLPLSPQLLLLIEPTRGVDIAAKAQIYQLLDTLRADGVAILITTTDLVELTTLSDRIAIARNGQLTTVLEPPEYSQARIIELSQQREQAA